MLRYTYVACHFSIIFLLLERCHFKFSFHLFTELLKTFAVIHTKHVFLISLVSITIVLLSSFDVIFSRHDFSSGHVCPNWHTQKHLLTALTEGFPCFSSVVRQMPGYNSQRRGIASTSQFTSQFFSCNYFFPLVFFPPCNCYVCSVLCILCTVCV
jgi:hypothetical protein